MKKFFIFVVVLVLAGTGLYFAKKYYDNEYLPQKILDENINAKKFIGKKRNILKKNLLE